VALNARPLIVFSEQIDARTLSNTTVQLLVAGVAVNGTVTPVPGDALLAEFTPAAPLALNTAYELLITTGVRDLEGDALESSERIPFTTQAQVPSVAYLTLSYPPSWVVPRLKFTLWAVVVGNNGNALWDRTVSWSSSDTSVAKVAELSSEPEGVTVHVTKPGATTITASSEGRSTSMRLSVADAPVSTALQVVAISMIEYQYPQLPGQRYYAPTLRVTAPAESAGVSVVGAYFDIPGIGHTNICKSRRPVAAGQTIDVFGDFYGDWEVSFDVWGARATSAEASGIIFLNDANGRLSHIQVSLPIVAGGFPTTYTGGTHPSWSC
jgi:hypothetical protein